MSNSYFQFKQFIIHHDKTAMKVGTDGVLLGAWAMVEKDDFVLDIGAGTGLIALMMAQRGAAHVDAVEIDIDAYHQAVDNVTESKWANSVRLMHLDINLFSASENNVYKRIVSNPPFFNNSLLSTRQNRTTARHSVELTWLALIQKAFGLLHSEGCFSVILPWPDAKQFVTIALMQGFYESRECLIYSREGKEANRVLLEFTRLYKPCQNSQLIIRNQDNSYTDAYKLLTKDFYLAF